MGLCAPHQVQGPVCGSSLDTAPAGLVGAQASGSFQAPLAGQTWHGECSVSPARLTGQEGGHQDWASGKGDPTGSKLLLQESRLLSEAGRVRRGSPGRRPHDTPLLSGTPRAGVGM